MINKEFRYAIVGASNNPQKYGHKVLADLQGAGFQVTPINQHETEILGLTVYHKVAEMPFVPDIVVFVVLPAVTEKVLEEVEELDIKKVWMQPGSESQKAIDYCNQHDIEHISGACIMVERRRETGSQDRS